MFPILLERKSTSPTLPEADPGRTNEIIMCSRVGGKVICDHAVIKKEGRPILNRESGYKVQKVRLVEIGDGTTCANCEMPKFR